MYHIIFCKLMMDNKTQPQRETKTSDLKEATKAPSPPPSLSLPTSPTHEFSFTISLHTPFKSSPPQTHSNNNNNNNNNRSSSSNNNNSSNNFLVDFTPADDIFFGGHLLPLHLLSHTPYSSADISIIRNSSIKGDEKLSHIIDTLHLDQPNSNNNNDNKERAKTKTFTSFFSLGKSQKSSENNDKEKEEENKKKWNMSMVLKKYYSNMIEALIFKGKKEKGDLRRWPYSFPGLPNGRERGGWKGKKVQLSAPSSVRASPMNSGLLSVSPTSKFSSSALDGSSLEELQNAIQSAVAHCKNSVAFEEEKCKC